MRRGFKTATEANDKLRELLAEDRKMAGCTLDLTVGELVDACIAEKRLRGRAPGTIDFNEWAAKHIRKRWGDVRAENLTFEDLNACYLEMLAGGKQVFLRGQGNKTTGEPYSTRSVNGVHELVRSSYALAVARGQVLRNPADLATKPRLIMKHKWWKPEEVGTFLDYVAGLDAEGTNPLPGGLIEMLVDTGGRRGETLAARWSDLNLQGDRDSTFSVTRQFYKGEMRPTKRPREKSVITLEAGTVTALQVRRRDQIADRLKMGRDWPGEATVHYDLVFTWVDGRILEPGYVTRTIGKMSVRAGLPRLTPHGLRHSFATAALAAGVPVEVVAHRLGNTVRVVRETYAHVIPASDAEAASTVADLYRQHRRAR